MKTLAAAFKWTKSPRPLQPRLCRDKQLAKQFLSVIELGLCAQPMATPSPLSEAALCSRHRTQLSWTYEGQSDATKDSMAIGASCPSRIHRGGTPIS